MRNPALQLQVPADGIRRGCRAWRGRGDGREPAGAGLSAGQGELSSLQEPGAEPRPERSGLDQGFDPNQRPPGLNAPARAPVASYGVLQHLRVQRGVRLPSSTTLPLVRKGWGPQGAQQKHVAGAQHQLLCVTGAPAAPETQSQDAPSPRAAPSPLGCHPRVPARTLHHGQTPSGRCWVGDTRWDLPRRRVPCGTTSSLRCLPDLGALQPSTISPEPPTFL